MFLMMKWMMLFNIENYQSQSEGELKKITMLCQPANIGYYNRL